MQKFIKVRRVRGNIMFSYSDGVSLCRKCEIVYSNGLYRCLDCGQKTASKPRYAGSMKRKYRKEMPRIG